MINTKRQKGEKLFTSVNDYTVFDLETTDVMVSQCKVIEISALRVRDNAVVDTFSSLVNPQIHIPGKITSITHITDEMVERAPTIEDIFDDFLKFVGNDIVIGHNIDTFDYNVIYDLNMKLHGKPFTNRYIDTLHLAQRFLPELENRRLPTLAEHLGIDITESHRGEADCYTTYKLYQALKELIETNGSRSILIKKGKGKENNQYAAVEKNQHNPFYDTTCIVYGAFKSMDTDKVKAFVQSLGANYVDFFCYSAQFLILGADMHKKYVCGIPDEMIDSVANQTNIRILSENDFLAYSNAVISSNSNALDVSFAFDVSRKTICLTGDFKCGEREKLENALVAQGAVIKNNVIKKLDYLVIGAFGNEDWKDGKGTKRIKAEEFNDKGANIAIINETELIVEKE